MIRTMLDASWTKMIPSLNAHYRVQRWELHRKPIERSIPIVESKTFSEELQEPILSTVQDFEIHQRLMSDAYPKYAAHGAGLTSTSVPPRNVVDTCRIKYWPDYTTCRPAQT